MIDLFTGEGVGQLVKKRLNQPVIVSEVDYEDGQHVVVDATQFDEDEELYVLARGNYLNGGYMYVVYSPRINEATTMHEELLEEVSA
ncbi:hypothetical protein [Brevibacillus daliensis]|uniref:hypothetical protein n=1 Tax=Brevibacillus daliensis TaxID=2892995 RepID=UPI001E33F5E1|nr:hypothetical protein [Brevibacillus daliensis]